MAQSKQQLIDQQSLEEYEEMMHDQKVDWISWYANGMRERKKDIIELWGPLTRAEDQHEDMRRDFIAGVTEVTQEDKRGTLDDETFILLNEMNKEREMKLDLFAWEIGHLWRLRERKRREEEEYLKRYNHWKLIKRGWNWSDDHKYGRFYYMTEEELECVLNAGAEETAKSISKKVWKIRKRLNVKLTEGLPAPIIFV